MKCLCQSHACLVSTHCVYSWGVEGPHAVLAAGGGCVTAWWLPFKVLNDSSGRQQWACCVLVVYFAYVTGTVAGVLIPSRKLHLKE